MMRIRDTGYGMTCVLCFDSAKNLNRWQRLYGAAAVSSAITHCGLCLNRLKRRSSGESFLRYWGNAEYSY